MLGVCCSRWEVAADYFFTQHAVKPGNSFPQAAVGAGSVALFGHTGAGDCHKGLLPLQVPAAKRGLSRLWAAGVSGMPERGCWDNQAAPGTGWVASGLVGTVAGARPEP